MSSIILFIKRFVLIILSLIVGLAASSCSTSSKKGRGANNREGIENKNPRDVLIKPINEKEVFKKISQFESALKSRGKNLTKSDWKLHDELLAIYMQLKNELISGAKIRIPARSKLGVELLSFCLNSGRAAPVKNEVYSWVKKATNIPYYEEIIKLSSQNNIEQQDAQTLLWNLGNKTYWENYPERLKTILQKIDPKVESKLPSKINDRVKEEAIDYIKNQIPLIDKVEDTLSFIEGEYYKYEDFARSVEELTSKYELKETKELTPIDNTSLYSGIKSDGYSAQNITFYNPTNKAQELDLSQYYLEPKRKDVQRIGVAGRPSQSNPHLLSQLEKVLYESMARLGVGFTPGLNDAADIYELLIGKDFVNGEVLTWGERLLSGVGLIAGSGMGFRYAARAANAPEEFLSQFERGFKNVASKELSLSSANMRAVRDFIEQTESTRDAIRASPTLRKVFEDANFKKTDFYVRPNGEVIPAKGYRYISSNAPYRDELVRTGRIPENPKGTYLSFNRYDQSMEAREKLQLFPDNDAGMRIEFDTEQMLDDIQIPRGRYGSADYLEPLTKDYPQYGVGAATQAITNRSIQASQIVDLKTGQSIYEAK